LPLFFSLRIKKDPVRRTINNFYIEESHLIPHAWSDQSLQGFFSPVSKGKRLIVVHAGSEKDSLPIPMHTNTLPMWLKDKLIPNFPPNSVLVVDNVHTNKLPTSNSRRDVMVSWLESHIEMDDFEKINFSNLKKAGNINLIWLCECGDLQFEAYNTQHQWKMGTIPILSGSGNAEMYNLRHTPHKTKHTQDHLVAVLFLFIPGNFTNISSVLRSTSWVTVTHNSDGKDIECSSS
ncbi:hypothetical protein C0J52_20109, partial [Blattella germanica]